MDTTKYRNCLMKFSTEELKVFLGGDLVDMLIEWTPDNEPLFTKSKLSDMIITIYGIEKLSDKSFRQALLYKLPQDDILSFRAVIPGRQSNVLGVSDIVAKIAQVPWKENSIILHLLNILGLHDYKFPNNVSTETVCQVIEAPERFFELLDYQFVIKQRTLNHLASGVELNRMLIHMPTGTGKTKTAMHTIIHHYNFNLRKRGLIVWMAHTNELLYQAHDTFETVWRHIGRESVNAYKLWGTFDIPDTETPLNGFLFCGFQKLMSVADKNPALFQRIICDCRLIVVDEAHKAAAPRTKEVISKIMVKKGDMADRALIGLTATPGRNVSDETDINRLIGMFDNKSISIEPDVLNMVNLTKFRAQNSARGTDIIRYFQDRNVLAKINRVRLRYPNVLSEEELKLLKVKATSNGYDDFTDKFLEVLGRSISRNKAILDKLVALDSEKIPTIIFACSVEHGKLLSTALTLKGIENACVFGDMNPSSRANAIKRFKDPADSLNVLINYEVLTTGFDATNIRCVFITRPTQSVVLYSQMIGRGLRGPQMGGNAECLLVDIEDNLKKYNESMAFSYFDSYWGN